MIDKILEDPDLTVTKFRRWKETNEELCQEIEKLALLKGSPALGAPNTTTTGDTDDNDTDDGTVEPRDASATAATAAEAPVAEEAVATETDDDGGIPETEGGAAVAAAAAVRGLSLSDGEQLVDAEPADVLLEIDDDPGSPGPATAASDDLGFFPPTLDLSLGSLQESIRRELSEMDVLPGGDGAVDNYFYI